MTVDERRPTVARTFNPFDREQAHDSCPGAPLARTVARIGMTAFVRHFAPGTVQLTDGFVHENVPPFFETGPRQLTVRASR